MNSDTPRCDSLTFKAYHVLNPKTELEVVESRYFQQLERELAVLVKERDVLTGRLMVADVAFEEWTKANSDLRATLAEREAKESSLIKELHTRIEERNATISCQADTLAERDREIESLKQSKEIILDRLDDAIAVGMDRDEKSELVSEVLKESGKVFADECDSLRAQLAETQKRVEQLMGINKELHGIFLHNLALQAHVEKLREALEYYLTTEHYMTAETVLSSRPDLPLIEEVREVFTLVCDKMGGPPELFDRIRKLLTRLNPRK